MNNADKLIQATIKNMDSEVLALLSKGIDPNELSSSGTLPLIVSAMSESRTILEALLRAGAEVNKRDLQKNLPLVGAVQAGKRDFVQVLLEHGADYNSAAAGVGDF